MLIRGGRVVTSRGEEDADVLIRDGKVNATRFDSAPFVSIPPTDRWSLGLLYLVFAIVIAILYVPCRWYAARKSQRAAWWMRYI